VNPTLIFLAPILAGIAAGRWAPNWAAWPAERRRRTAWCCLGALAVLGLLGLLVLSQFEWLTISWQDVRLRLAHPHWAVDFVREYGRLMSGVNIYACFVGPVPRATRWALEFLFWIAAAPLAAFGTWRLIRARRWPELGMEIGFFVGMILLYFRAAEALRPGVERYVVSFIVTGAILAVIWLKECVRGRDLARAIMLAGCAVLLAVFYVQYFCDMREAPRSDGIVRDFEPLWRTARVEPRQAACDLIRACAPKGPVTVLTQDYVMAGPLQYLTLRDERIAVVDQSDEMPIPDPQKPGYFKCTPRELKRDQWRPGTRFFSVEFVEFPRQKKPLPGWLRVAHDWIIRDYSGEPLIAVRELKPVL